MKKIYYSIYASIVTFIIALLVYIFIFDNRVHTEHYFPVSGVTTWTDYTFDISENHAVLKGHIPANSGNTLAFYSIHTNIAIYCNNELIYQYPVKNTNPFAKTPGYSWNFVHLPSADREIEILYTASYDGYVDSTPCYYLGDTVSILGEIMNSNLLPYLVCVLIFLFGVCMILYWLYLRTQIHLKPSLLFLGIFAVVLSIWSGNESYLAKLLFANNIVTSYISFIMLMLCPLPFAQFVRSYYQDDSIVWDIFCLVNIIQVILCISLQLLKKCDLRNTLWTTHVIIFALIFIVIARSYARIKKGNNSTQIKTHLFCIVVCTITLAIDLILYYTKVMDGNVFGRLGFFLYIVILGFTASKESTKLIQLGKKADTYKKLAFTDQVTNLYNRTAYNTDFEDLLSEPDDVGIINFDLNNLKRINDTKGHAFGDLYITSASKIISDTFSEFAKCYRVGGDEFVVIIKHFSDFDIHYLFAILENKIQCFNNSQEDFDLQIAYGYACFDPELDSTLKNTSRRADRYMYQNKVRKKHGL